MALKQDVGLEPSLVGVGFLHIAGHEENSVDQQRRLHANSKSEPWIFDRFQQKVPNARK